VLRVRSSSSRRHRDDGPHQGRRHSPHRRPVAEDSASDPTTVRAVCWSDAAAEDLLRWCSPAATGAPPAAQIPAGTPTAAASRQRDGPLLWTTEPTVAQAWSAPSARSATRDLAEVPPRAEWPDRLGAVLAVVAGVHEGHAARRPPTSSGGACATRHFRLTALLRRLCPTSRGARAVGVATHHRRPPGRADCALVLLATRTDACGVVHDVERGVELATRGAAAGACPSRGHCRRRSRRACRCSRNRLAVSRAVAPAVVANRAAAIALADGPAAGLAAAERVEARPATTDCWFSALSSRAARPTGRGDGADARAMAATRDAVERRHLERRLDAWAASRRSGMTAGAVRSPDRAPSAPATRRSAWTRRPCQVVSTSVPASCASVPR
jgi:RNA polymerase sigma-70 factor (ECF subfamily)